MFHPHPVKGPLPSVPAGEYVHMRAGVSVGSRLVWCGREGFLTMRQIIERTEEGITQYRRAQPLRFATAMQSRDQAGRPIHGAHFPRRHPCPSVSIRGSK